MEPGSVRIQERLPANETHFKTLKENIKTVVFKGGEVGYRDHPGRIFTIQMPVSHSTSRPHKHGTITVEDARHSFCLPISVCGESPTFRVMT